MNNLLDKIIDSVKLRSKDFYTKEEVIETIERHKLKESTGELFLTSGLPDITIDGLHISPQMHLVMAGDTRYQLNKKQFSLLYLLMSNRDTIMSSSELFKTVWGVDYKNDQTLTWYMSRVRKVAPNNIFNVKGKGYIWRGSN